MMKMMLKLIFWMNNVCSEINGHLVTTHLLQQKYVKKILQGGVPSREGVPCRAVNRVYAYARSAQYMGRKSMHICACSPRHNHLATLRLPRSSAKIYASTTRTRDS